MAMLVVQATEPQRGPQHENSTPPLKTALRQRRDARELDKGAPPARRCQLLLHRTPHAGTGRWW